MSKSTITRERLLEIIVTGPEASGAEQNALARMALAAMDSEPVACGNGCSKSKWHKMALDIDEYMNGEDARESKGRDEIYSEIILRLTRLDVLETILRNEIGLPYGSPIPDIAEKIYDIKRARIYSVVPDDVLAALQKVARIRLDLDEFDGDRRGIADCLGDAEEALIEVVNRRAAMLQAEPVCTCPSGDGSLRWPCPVHPGNSPAIGIDLASGPDRTVEVHYVAPPGYVMVPKEPTSEMVKKMRYHVGSYDRNIKDGYKAMLAAAPQSHGSEPATVPGKWIPVSEKMPPSRHEVLVGRWWGEKPRWCCKWATYIPGHPDAQSSGWLIPGASWTPTHWMELPAGPKEVK